MSGSRFYSDDEAEEILRHAARDSQGGPISGERLLQMASELGISPEAVARAEREVAERGQSERDRADFKRSMRAGFVNDLVGYFSTYMTLVAIWFFTGAGYFWPMWPLLAWSIGLISSFQSHFILSPEQREKKFQRWLRKRASRSELPQDVN